MGVSVVLTVHNKEFLIQKVLDGICANASRNVKELIIVLDGCTDGSEGIVNYFSAVNQYNIPIKTVKTPDIFETKANNVGMKLCKEDYIILVQDDMVIQEPGYDMILLYPFMYYADTCHHGDGIDLFAVSGRKAHHNKWINNELAHTDLIGEEHNNLSIGQFAFRQVAIRGPLMLSHYHLKTLNYLNEEYAPYTLDDHDICYRAYEKCFAFSGVIPIKVLSLPEWGTTRQKNFELWNKTFKRNSKLLYSQHGKFFNENPNKTEQIY